MRPVLVYDPAMGGEDRSRDRYLHRRILGEGSGGRVWLVEDLLRPGSRLALKELHGKGAEDLRHEEELRREFATLACLKHPSLVEVHEFDTSPESGLPRFTLEFIQGRSVVDAVAHEGPEALLPLAAEALRALAFLHDFGLIHRDLKPGNLLVRDRPKLGCRLVLVDFGLVHPADSEPLEARHARGTLPYMAPELFRNEVPSARSDLYALGAVLHEAIHGRPPSVPAERDLSRFVRDVSEGRRARPPLPPGFPRGIAPWLEEMLAPDVAERPASAREALARLNDSCATRFPAETPASRAARLLSGPPAERRGAIEEVWGALDPGAGPRVVWLAGGPGSGKTRVLRWLEAEAVLRGWRVECAGDRLPVTLGELRASANSRPTLVLIDEADSAGGPVAEALDRVAREAERPPLQVVASLRAGPIRSPALRKLFEDTGTVPTLRRVDLGRLDMEGIRAMAVRATGGEVSEERVRRLHEASEGLPAVAEALLIEGVWERGPRAETGRAPGAGAASRLDMLSPAARAWLEALAVLRRDARDPDVAELAGLPPADALAAAEEAAGAGLAFRRSGRWRADSTALVERLLSGLGPERRRSLHRSAAEALARSAGEEADPWLLARLWLEAGERARAIEEALRAADRSLLEGDPAEAAERLSQAVRWIGRSRDARRDARMRQGKALVAAGLHGAAARAFGAAAWLAGKGSGRGEAAARQALALVQAGRFRRGLACAGRAARLAEGAPAALAAARRAAGIALARQGREREAIRMLRRALEVARSGGDASAEAEVLQVLASCEDRLGRAEEARKSLLSATEILRRRRDAAAAPDARELKALLGLAVLESRAGALDRAAELLEDVRRAAAERGSLDLQQSALSRHASVAIDQGRLDAAMRLAEQAADLALHLGDPNLVLVGRARLADARIRCGQAGEAAALLQRTLDAPLDRVEPENADYARMLLADSWMESGGARDEAVATLLSGCLERCRKRGKARPWMMALTIEMERRSRPACPDPFETVAAEYERLAGAPGAGPEPEIRVRAGLAVAARRLATGDPEGAAAAASAAAGVAREAGHPAFEARARAALAEALRRAGREAAARKELEEGRALLERAARRIEDPAIREGFLSRAAYEPLAREREASSSGEQRRLEALYGMVHALNSETDPEALLESILDMALRAVGAERGMILLKEEEQGAPEGFSIRLARNLEAETVRDAESYSRSIVAAAGAGRSMLALDAGADPRFRDLKSVSLYGIRSLICVPLRSRGTIVGTVYLDSRRDGTLFTPADLRFLEAFADHAALALENARARARLERQNLRLQAAAESRTEFANLVGRSPGMQAVFDLVERVAATDLPVLIRGETGTGKELVARAIHFHGARRRRTFLSENCAAIPETLLESELFGHVRGAFTGAERSRPGLFEQADGGTLFLDEVGDMSPAMQVRLLRVLESGEIRRVGGERTIRVNVRVLAATHRDLAAETRAGRFREDLLYRLQVLTIEIPPLRKRPGDVELLSAHFLSRIATERGRAPQPIDDEALGLLERHAWPGNVRELQSALQRLSIVAGGGPITAGTLAADPDLRKTLVSSARPLDPVFSLRIGERERILAALEAARGSRTRAARLLGVSRATLYRKIDKHHL